MVKSFPQLPFTVAFMDKQLFALTKTSGKDSEIKQLIQSLDADLKIRYGEATIHGVDLEEADASGMHFFIGHYGKTAICCGAIRPFSKIQVEVKRMYVRPEYRGNGYAKKLYLKLEQTAFDLGYREILLETGKKQFEAHALYRKIGFQPIEKFGEYVNDPNSLCFSKLIDDY